jgi:hypothetical protein
MNQALYAPMNNKRKMKKKIVRFLLLQSRWYGYTKIMKYSLKKIVTKTLAITFMAFNYICEHLAIFAQRCCYMSGFIDSQQCSFLCCSSHVQE